MIFGGVESDFSRWANLADRNMEHFRDYSHNSQQFWLPSDSRFDDGEMVSAPAGRYQPNAWGLYDMHGNVWEWTRSDYNNTLDDSQSAGENGDSTIRKVVRGGSWFDRPSRSSSSFRLGYPAWQGVFNVGFRVVCENGEK
jgi:formylglycine-generating enzyme required for sulfatase activity